jgi:hypothetical protein
LSLTANTELIICSVETQSQHPELFHYTKRDAFQSIVTSGTFWASHYADMADPAEVLLMRDLLPAAVAPRFKAIVAELNRHDRRNFGATGGADKLAADFVNELYNKIFLNRTGFTALDAFSVSFSTHADDGEFEREHGLASQWRGYAGDEGFCLVFDTSAMARCLGQEMDSRYWVRLTLDPVRYADAPIDQLFPELVNASADTLRQFLSGVRTPEMAVPEFLAGTTLLKGASFRSEREIRIVAIPGTRRLSDQAVKEHPDDFTVLPVPEVRMRPETARRYIPIFEIASITLPIKRVIVGPSSRQGENAAFARSLVGNMPVTCSKCSLSTEVAR